MMIPSRAGGARARQSHLHHPPPAGRNVRHGGLDALARVRGRPGGPGEGRQRVRRRGGYRPGAPGGRAAPERARRRGAGDRLRRGRGRGVRARRPGGGAGRGHDRGVHRAGPGPGPRQRPAGGDRARGVRHLDAAARARLAAVARGHGVRDRLRQGRLPDAGHRQRDDRRGVRPVPRPLANLGRDLPGRRGARTGRPLHQQAAGRLLHPHPGRGRGGGAGPGGPDRGRPAGLVRGLRGRGHRRLPGCRRGDGHHRRAPPRAADRPGHGLLAVFRGSSGDAGVRRPDRVQDRAVGPGPGVPAAACPAPRVRPGRDGGRQHGPGAHRDRVRQARLRRP